MALPDHNYHTSIFTGNATVSEDIMLQDNHMTHMVKAENTILGT
jgi:hypothetical protein